MKLLKLIFMSNVLFICSLAPESPDDSRARPRGAREARPPGSRSLHPARVFFASRSEKK